MNKFNHYNQYSILDAKKDILTGKSIETNNGEKISSNDIFNFHGLSDDEIIEIINKELKIDVNTIRGIEKLNEVFFKGLDVYEKTIGRFNHYKIDINKFEPFDNKNDLIHFLKKTNEDSLIARKYCVISKFCRSVNKVLTTPLVHDLEAKYSYILSYFKEPLYLEQVGDDYVGHLYGGKEKIDFLLTSRIKGFNSCVLKTLHDPKYEKAKDLKDGLGFTFKVDNWKQALLLMQYVDSILETTTLDVKSKVGNLNELLINSGHFLRDEFIQKLNLSDLSKKMATSENYEDLKLVGILEGNIPIEIKFVLKNGENENGINFEPIYAMLKKDLEGNIIRLLKQYVDIHDLNAVVDDFLKKINNHIEESPIKRGASEKDYLLELWDDLKKENLITGCHFCYIKTLLGKRKIIKNGLVERLKNSLIKVKLESGDIVYTNSRALKLSEDGVYKKMIKLD